MKARKSVVRVSALLLLICLSALLLAACGQKALQNEPYDIPDEAADTSLPLAVRVASFNLYGAGMTAEKAEKINAFLADNPFDFVGFQEVDKNLPRSGDLDYPRLLRTGAYTDFFFAPTYALGERYGIGTLARGALRNTHVFRLPYPSAYVGAIEQRVLTRVVADVGGVAVVFYDTHLSFEDAELRARQLSFIAETLRADVNPYKILAGDFNIAALSELDVLIAAGMRVVFTEGSSHESDGLIDNVLHSETLRVTHAQIRDVGTSDHRLLDVSLTKA